MAGAAAGNGAQDRGVAEHLHQRDAAVDLLRALAETAHAVDAAAAAVDVADDLAHVFVGGVDLDLHDRFQNVRRSLGDGFLDGQLGAGLEGLFAGVHGVETAVEQDELDVHHRIAGVGAFFH